MNTPSDKGVGDITTFVSHSVLHNRSFTWLVLAVGLIISSLASFYMKTSIESIAELEFADHCEDIQLKIMERLEDHARILRSGAAFFEASDTVTREKWRIFTRQQRFEKQLPGIQGIGFSQLIPRAELSRHILKIRS